MSDFRLLLTLWCLVCACVFFVWVLRWATAGISRWAQAPKRPRYPPPPPPDPAKVAEEERAQRRREDARARIELIYSLHEPELRDRFPAAAVADYLRRYLGDDRPAERVELYAGQLEALIRSHLRRVVPPRTDAPDAALREAQRYYLGHADLLREVFPPELFRAYVRHELHELRTSAEQWAACQRLIETLRQHVSEERQRRRGDQGRHQERAGRLQQIDRDIANLRAALARARRNELNAPADVVRNDVESIEEQIHHLEQQRELIQNPGGDPR